MSRISLFLTLAAIITVCGYSQEPVDPLRMAMAHYMQKNYSAALLFFDEAVRKMPEKQDLYLWRGRCKAESGSLESSIDDFKKILLSQPGPASFELAKVYARMGKPDEALYYLKLHLEKGKRKPESEIKLDKSFQSIESTEAWKNFWKSDWYSKTEMEEADVRFMIHSGDYIPAIDRLNLLISKNSKRDEWYFLRASAYSRMKEEKLAVNDLNRAIDLDKRNAQYYALRGQNLVLQKKYAKAASDFRKAIDMEVSNLPLMIELAECLYEEKENSLAKSTIQEYLKYFPDNMKGMILAGKIEYALNDYEESLVYFNKCIQKDASQSQVFYLRGITWLELRKYMEAINDFAQTLDLDNANAEAWYSKGIARLYQGDESGACSDFKQAAKLGHRFAYNKMHELCAVE